MKNRTAKTRASLALLGAASVMGYLLMRGVESSPIQQQAPTAQALFLATAQQRDEWMDRVRANRVTIARSGFEAGRAGFHLMRPDDDPQWKDATTGVGCSGSVYCWDYARPRYPGLAYHAHGIQSAYVPAVPLPQYCLISLNRVFSNSLATLHVVPRSSGAYDVQATFSPQSVAALAALLQPKNNEPVFGLLDWFGTSRASESDATEMKVVLVSDDFAFVPFSAQSICAQAPGPVMVVVATDLSLTDAEGLIAKFSL